MQPREQTVSSVIFPVIAEKLIFLAIFRPKFRKLPSVSKEAAVLWNSKNRFNQAKFQARFCWVAKKKMNTPMNVIDLNISSTKMTVELSKAWCKWEFPCSLLSSYTCALPLLSVSKSYFGKIKMREKPEKWFFLAIRREIFSLQVDAFIGPVRIIVST